MKAEIKDTAKEEFAPVVLTITIETADDLMELWHRFNWTASENYHLSYPEAKDMVDRSDDVWNKLNNLVIKREIYM